MPRARRDEVLAALPGFELFWAGEPPGMVTPCSAAEPEGCHQTWVRDPTTGSWRLDIFSEPSDRDTWICRRDPSIRMPYDRLIERTPDGIPYGRPEVMLLFKAKPDSREGQRRPRRRPPRLEPGRQRWLADALARVDPEHRWLRELRAR